MIKNIIFDWAGCLSNDLVQTYKTTMYVFEESGIDKLSLDEFKESFVLPYMDFYRKYTDRPKEEIDNLFMEGLALAEEPELFPSTKGILDYLKNKGIKMALFSSHPQDVLLEEVERFGLEKYFVCVCGNVYDKTKEIKSLMEKNNFSSRETIYIGDMVHDIEAGREAEVTVIAIYWGFQTKEKLAQKKPDYLIGDLSELKEIVSSFD